ncbi:hypothetical protein [Schleiferilactobacillus shenzhenensis]|uniref:N-acetyltransferase domain-containing protein n=1 Tax=Schleiferilactobacillus shenzhenensis LY-73 TaxID=1231336 RepID=U4TVV2_9LACO|nr:hypothetical protein [Schleiferilactobacillus shenzhenensis]ERL65973.1 hypothetical protein L248_2049 [Schleiferilactobacillus shenzhenensis LY-73]
MNTHDLINQQLALDFSCPPTVFDQPRSFFTTAPAVPGARYWARDRGTIVCLRDRLFCRTDNAKLTAALSATFAKAPGQWFMETANLYLLDKILAPYGLAIANHGPFFVPPAFFPVPPADPHFLPFAETPVPIFHFSKKDGPDSLDHSNQFSVQYTANGDIRAVANADQDGAHTWEIGIELLDPDYAHQGVATQLVHRLVANLQALRPNVLPVYGTQFSHTRSMNVAIRAGLIIGWTELVIGDRERVID